MKRFAISILLVAAILTACGPAADAGARGSHGRAATETRFPRDPRYPLQPLPHRVH